MNRKSAKIGIVILNYNSSNETKNLISSIKCHENINDLRCLIVDNNSSQEDIDNLKDIQDCEFIFLHDNQGYAHGNNVGIKDSIDHGCEYIVIANSDTELLEDDTIEKLIHEMNNLNADIIGPKIVDKSGKNTAGAGYLTRFGKVREKRPSVATSCDCIIGAFFIINKDCILNMGLINEDYFLYLEETDYFYRAHNAGYKVLYFPDIKVRHYGGVTSSDVYDYYISRNRFILIDNCFGTPQILVIIYLLFEFLFRDIRQLFACMFGIRNYNFRFRRANRWSGYFAGIRHEKGKANNL